MKTATRILGIFAIATLLAGLAEAQVQFVFVEKKVDYTQNSAAAPTINTGTPYSFQFQVNGSGMSTYAATHNVEITNTATSSGTTGPITASYSNSSGEEQWKTSVALYSTKPAMDGAFANGVYGLNVNNTAFNVTLGSGSGPYSDSYPAAAPMLTGLTAGDFDGSGNLLINKNLSTYTFTLNGLPGYTSGGHIGIFLAGVTDSAFVTGNNPSGSVQAESIYFSGAGMTDPEVTFLTFNPSTSSMVAGQNYSLELEYNLAPNAAVGAVNSTDLNLGLFSYRTVIAITAIPEPSTYTAIAGVIALAGVILQRRRRLA